MTGFKSFSEKTTVLIEKVTGIVGPNGCGKSNIVEALRWCMEKIQQKVLGLGMEDVIFLAHLIDLQKIFLKLLFY